MSSFVFDPFLFQSIRDNTTTDAGHSQSALFAEIVLSPEHLMMEFAAGTCDPRSIAPERGLMLGLPGWESRKRMVKNKEKEETARHSRRQRLVSCSVLLMGAALLAFAVQYRKLELGNDEMWNLSFPILALTFLFSLLFAWKAWTRILQYLFNRAPRRAGEAALLPIAALILLLFYPLCGGIPLDIRFASAFVVVVLASFAVMLLDVVPEWNGIRGPAPREALAIALCVSASLATLALGNLTHNIQKDWVATMERLESSRRLERISLNGDVRSALIADRLDRFDWEERLKDRPYLVFSLALRENADMWKEQVVVVRAGSVGGKREIRIGFDELLETAGERWKDVVIDLREFGNRDIRLRVAVERDWRRIVPSSPRTAASRAFTPLAWRWESRTKELFYITPPRIVHGPGEEKDFNIILISLDTLRADHLGFYGYRRETAPNLALIAQEATVFTNFFSTATYTLPAHMSLFSSLYPSAHRIYRKDFGISHLKFRTLAELVKDAGYYTAAFTGGGFVSSTYGFHQGFDSYRDGGRESVHGFGVENRVREALSWLEQYGRLKFFLFLHTYEIHDHVGNRQEHRQFYVTDYDGRLEGPYLKLVHPRAVDKRKSFKIRDEDIRYMEDLYDGAIRHTDRHLGELFDVLRDMGLYDNTLILITSDHRESFGELHDDGEMAAWTHGNPAYESQIRIPLIMKMPRSLGISPRVVDCEFSLVDVMPSLADMLELKPQTPLQGISWAKAVDGAEPEGHHRPILVMNHPNIDHKCGVRVDGLKYIRHQGQDELYDLGSDPGEFRDLSENPAFAEELTRLSGILRKHFAESEGLQRVPESRGPIPKELEKQLEALGYLN